MKFLTTINCFGLGGFNNIILALAWKRFLDHYKDKIDSDFVFVNNGFRPARFSTAVIPYRTFDIEWKLVSVPFDSHMTFLPINAFKKDYDYIIRADHDVFPSVDCLNTIISFVKTNPEIDFISASNFCRTIEFVENPDYQRGLWESKKECTWEPWRYPAPNGDIFIIKTEFLRKCLKNYLLDKRIYKRTQEGDNCPFATNVLTYQEICKLLNYEEKRFSGAGNMRIHLDGNIGVDFWTYMCASKMNMAGIIDKGGSFQNKNYAMMFMEAVNFKSWNEIKDNVDISFSHKKNVIAPYFHLGNGYLVNLYFQPDSEEKWISLLNIVKQLQSNNFGYYGVHLALVRLLTFLTNNRDQITTLEGFTNEMIDKYKIDKAKFNAFSEKVVTFYTPAIKEYL